jgi:hypothetical protein
MLAMLRAIWLIATETAFVAYVAPDRFACSYIWQAGGPSATALTIDRSF